MPGLLPAEKTMTKYTNKKGEKTTLTDALVLRHQMLRKEEVVHLADLDKLLKSTGDINGLLARYGVKFGIYKNGAFKEQLFPFDPIPRIIRLLRRTAELL